MDITEVKIDEELEQFLPALNAEQTEKLATKIDREGWIDHLTVWEETGLLVDGHNRYRIWESKYRGKQLPGPNVIVRSFKSRSEVMGWMLENQDSRRNWTNEQRDAALARYYEAISADGPGAPKGNSNNKSQRGHFDPFDFPPPKKAIQKAAEAFGVSESTAKRAVRKEREKAKKDKPKLDQMIEETPDPICETLAKKKQFTALVSSAGRILAQIQELAEQDCGKHINWPNAQRDIGNLQSNLKFAAPHAHCPYCLGKGCKPCKDLGWVVKTVFNQAPEDLRNAAQKLSK